MDRAIPFIRQAIDDCKPFFAVIWFHAPHEPIIAGPDYLALYEGYDEEAHYYGAITEMDEQIGRLRVELEALGAAGNTFITFTSDNGPEGKEAEGKRAGTTGGLRGRKRSLYEGGVRVPTVTVWPGRVSPGTTIDVPTSTLDYLPTVLGILNIRMPDDRPIDGVSMMPLLTGTANTRPQPIPFWHKERMALIQGNLKLVMTPDKPDGDELYDLGNDVVESNDIAATYEDVAASMRLTLEAFAESARASDNGADYPD
jgi:arylsulfatase A-like enzyme